VTEENRPGFKQELISKLEQYPGDVEVFLHLGRRIVLLDSKYHVQANLKLKDQIAALCGKKNVWFY